MMKTLWDLESPVVNSLDSIDSHVMNTRETQDSLENSMYSSSGVSAPSVSGIYCTENYLRDVPGVFIPQESRLAGCEYIRETISNTNTSTKN